MAYELFNQGQVTPARLHAMLRLVARRPGLTRKALADLVQPPSMVESQNAAELVIAAAVSMDLVNAGPGRSGTVELTVPKAAVEQVDAFRRTMADRTLGVTDSDAPNYVFNLFTAWYAALDADVLGATTDPILVGFNEQVFGAVEGQQVNATKYAAWRPWAAFFGYGWLLTRGKTTFLVPDAGERVGAVLDRVLEDVPAPLPFREFRRRLAETCPELDGGVLFERASDARHGGGRGQVVSLMLSTALRGLHDAGRCELLNLADAGDSWRLFPATGAPPETVTHVAAGTERHA